MSATASSSADWPMRRVAKRSYPWPTDFPRIWTDPELPARERKRMLRLLIEDVTLLKTDKITAHVRSARRCHADSHGRTPGADRPDSQSQT